MPAEVFEEAITLKIGLLEAIAPKSAQEAGYPFPRLVSTPETDMREFVGIVLENPYLRLTIVPALGGRILNILDKRTGLQVLPVRSALISEPGGSRGVRLMDGIQFTLDGGDRANSLGNVASQIEEPMDDDDEASVWLSEIAGPISWHLRVSLPSNRAEIGFEARVLNRSLEPVSYNSGLTGVDEAFGWSSPSERIVPHANGIQRFDQPQLLGPRQVDSWELRLAPYSGLAPNSSSVEAAMAVGESLKIQAAQPYHGAKVLLLTEDGQTMEAPLDLYPEAITEMPLGGLKPKAVVLRSAKGDELCRFPSETVSREEAWQMQSFNAGLRHIAYLERGIEALANREFSDADREFETALLYNGDDPLLWWIKAVTQRLMGNVDQRPELENAHYLSPLEPALRAEAFLTQSAEQGREANPLLKNLTPDEFLEVACLLLDHKLPDQANRWIDEALRHADLAMLRYLMADTLMQGTRMETEAAHHVVAGAKAQLPPYPWRRAEREAIKRLLARFPSDTRLKELTALLGP